MSKKKGSGNTMTLKDFHGGSIPTDLPLPSAPGVTARPLDRASFDRPATWANPMSRLDHRSRPHSSPATRHFDDKTPFLAPAAHIGRNFDEDERKPLGGVTPPRRTISDESIKVMPSHAELKPQYESSDWQKLAPAIPSPVNSYAGRVSDTMHSGAKSQNVGGGGGGGGGGGVAFSGGHPNAWQARKEVVSGVHEHLQSAWNGPSAVSKLAHASALEKVSSGRWQSKQSMPYQTDVFVVASSEPDGKVHSNSYGNSFDSADAVAGRDYHDSSFARHTEREFGIDDGTEGHRHDFSEHDRVGVPKFPVAQERSVKLDAAGAQHSDSNQIAVGHGSEVHHSLSTLVSERPKLKLLPRTKPLLGSELNIADHTQIIPDAVSAENVNEVYGYTSPVKPGLGGSESAKDGVERPKLNLKPRSQPIEHSEGHTGRDRMALFGGARPREQVLKERGFDNASINNHDFIQNSERADESLSRTERVQGLAVPMHQTGKTENPPFDRRIGKEGEKKDNRADVEPQKKNFRENRRKNKETDRQQQIDRPSSPETWRKPAEQPKSTSSNAVGMRHGKVASALELAQAFSRSVSDSKVTDRLPNQRNSPGRSQIPFSRLTEPSPRPQINGY